MEKINKKIWTFLENDDNIQDTNVEAVRVGSGYCVETYRKLVESIAKLAFYNPEFLLFYRGQKKDHSENLVSTLYPTIFRGQSYSLEELLSRFRKLKNAEDLLINIYNSTFVGAKKIRTYDILRWAILQHYEVCSTPLLDITHSLCVACSIAHYQNEKEGFVYVLGLPQVSGSVTTSSEHGIQVIRLLSICPPNALRPYYQEGYSVGDFPTIGYREKLEYERKEVDLAQRLICKFKINKKNKFWDNDFIPISDNYLFPDDEHDEFLAITKEVKGLLRNEQ